MSNMSLASKCLSGRTKKFFANHQAEVKFYFACIPKIAQKLLLKFGPYLSVKASSLQVQFYSRSVASTFLQTDVPQESTEEKMLIWGIYTFTRHPHCAAALCIIRLASHFIKSDHCRKERAQMQWSN